jgi:hypothetical protein
VPPSPRISTCGCAARPRRRCPECAEPLFFACSAACLERHGRERHADTAELTAQRRAVRAVAALNANAVSPWEAYTDHRNRLSRLCCAVQRGQGLCVLGAGNCEDLDLPLLVREFGEVHLVDLDGEALARGVARLSESQRLRVVTHAGLDLTGLLHRIDQLAEGVPGDAALADLGTTAAAALARTIGRTFDVVLSDCIVSQLPMPFRDALLLDRDEWQRLQIALDRTHFTTMAALTRPGGAGVIACDVLSSQDEPALLQYASPATWDALGAALAQRIGHGDLALDPSPPQLLALLQSPDLARLIERPRLTEPWTWNLGDGLQLVCAILWTRIDPSA